MINDEYRRIATLALAKCASNDPWFPHAGDATILGWAEAFQDSRLSEEDLLAGVSRAYRIAEEGFRPLPSVIIKHAQAAYFEALRDLPDDRRKLMETANHALQDMEFTPNDAHRYSRAIALGRKPRIDLTPEQDTELRNRITAAREVLNEPPRHLESLWNIAPDRNTGRDPQRAFKPASIDNQQDAA